MHRKIFQNISYLFCGLILLAACKKDKPKGENTSIPQSSNQRVLVVCEGSLGNGNAELSVYLKDKDSVYNNVYKNANGQALGDVFQSISRVKNQYFLSINNSDKIVVLDTATWLQRATISVPKPRKMFVLNERKAYVGSLFSNKIYVIDPSSYGIIKQLTMPYKSVESMLLKDSLLYVACWDTACNKIYQININTDQIIDSIAIAGYAPHALLEDREQKIWVLAGNTYKGRNATWTRIDPSTRKTIKQHIFNQSIEAIKPVFNATKDTLYYIEVNYSGATENNGIYRLPIQQKDLPALAFIPCQNNQYFWALGIDPYSGYIYVGDPKGFVQKGSVSMYNSAAQLQGQFSVGLGVGAFYFD